MGNNKIKGLLKNGNLFCLAGKVTCGAIRGPKHLYKSFDIDSPPVNTQKQIAPVLLPKNINTYSYICQYSKAAGAFKKRPPPCRLYSLLSSAQPIIYYIILIYRTNSAVFLSAVIFLDGQSLYCLTGLFSIEFFIML